MANIVGVRFKEVGKVYYFDPVNLDVKKDDCVIVETARGIEMGRVVFGTKSVSEEECRKGNRTMYIGFDQLRRKNRCRAVFL